MSQSKEVKSEAKRGITEHKIIKKVQKILPKPK